MVDMCDNRNLGYGLCKEFWHQGIMAAEKMHAAIQKEYDSMTVQMEELKAAGKTQKSEV